MDNPKPSPARMHGRPWPLFLSIPRRADPLNQDLRGGLINFLYRFVCYLSITLFLSLFSLASFVPLFPFILPSHPSTLFTTLASSPTSSKTQQQQPKMFWTCQPVKKRKDTDKLTRSNAFAPCNRVLAIPELRALLYSFFPSGLSTTTTTTTRKSSKNPKGAACMLVCRHWNR